MRFGLNFLLWTTHLDDRHAGALGLAARLGYDVVELPVFDTSDPGHYARLGRRLDELGLARTAASALPAEADPSSPDPAVRRAALDRLKAQADCTAEMGGTMLIGPLHSALGRFSGAGPTADEIARSVEVVREAADHAAAAGVALGIEPLNRFECYLMNTLAQGAAYCADVGRPNVGVLYDTFHAHIEEKDPAAAVRAHAASILHVHVSENDRSTPGAGQVAWGPTFRALAASGYDGILMVEAFGLALPELSAATRIWRRMFESEERLARDAIAFMRSAWAEAAAAEGRNA